MRYYGSTFSLHAHFFLGFVFAYVVVSLFFPFPQRNTEEGRGGGGGSSAKMKKNEGG